MISILASVTMLLLIVESEDVLSERNQEEWYGGAWCELRGYDAPAGAMIRPDADGQIWLVTGVFSTTRSREHMRQCIIDGVQRTYEHATVRQCEVAVDQTLELAIRRRQSNMDRLYDQNEPMITSPDILHDHLQNCAG